MKKLFVVGILFGFTGAWAQTGGGEKKPAPAAPMAPAAKPSAPKPAAAPAAAGAPAAKPGAPAAAGAPAAKPGAPAAATPTEPPPPPKAGPETAALKPFVPHSATWTGKAPAGAFGPSSPEMPAKGKIACKWIINDLWASCDLTDTVGSGKQAMKYVAHQVMGWDFGAKEYRSVFTDSFGGAGLMKGKLDGAKLTWESATESFMMGQPTKFRISFDATDPKALKMVSEHTGPDKKWVVDEESVFKSAGGK